MTHKSLSKVSGSRPRQGFAKDLNNNYAGDISQSQFICFCILAVGRPERPAFSTYCCDTTPPLREADIKKLATTSLPEGACIRTWSHEATEKVKFKRSVRSGRFCILTSNNQLNLKASTDKATKLGIRENSHRADPIFLLQTVTSTTEQHQ